MPQYREGYLQEIETKAAHMSVMELTIEHMTGKQASELME